MHRARSSPGPGRPAAHPRPRGRVGLTLLELLLVLTLLSLLLGAGVGVLSQLDVGRRAAAGAVQNLIRVAQNSSVSRRAPARVRLDRAAGLVEAEALVVVGTWHFEGGGTDGAFGLDGTSVGGELVDDGWIGQALGFARASRGSYAQFPVHLDPAFDLSAGFTLDCAVRIEAERGGRLLKLGEILWVEITSSGGVRVALQPEVEGPGGVPSRGGRIALESPPGLLSVDRWARLQVSYDRSRLSIAVDGVEQAAIEEEARVWRLEGPLVLSDPGRPFPGSIDSLSVSAVLAGEAFELPEGTTLGADAPPFVRFLAGGYLDRRMHPQAILFHVDYEDGKSDAIRVGLYGTVE